MLRDTYKYVDLYKNTGRNDAESWKEERAEQMKESEFGLYFIRQFIEECGMFDAEQVYNRYNGEVMTLEEFEELVEDLDYPCICDYGMSGKYNGVHWYGLNIHDEEVEIYVK